jgi:heme-degrading monooxygenase HmoA
MIVRTWRGRASKINSDKYLRHFQSNVFPELERIEGFQNAHVMQRGDGDLVEILVMTMWNSMDDVRRFAGDDPTQAVVEPEARKVLTDYDATVKHYGLVFGPKFSPQASE